ncbi:hypothetical protein BK133_26215 [Paenibacillus sp. FSL H8-0548]|uniref:hypothetical protein n=1 Tax=Paenibacillus sp. FSL H8-0548 TaxID=1920422 RepID=UPI00096D4182|nr:hypothetical protein [Paenibacillus sp. FSL H8-0548]OMF22535.1 hypothetical protein BK133_26215 [Paenibacillus sp. FSL H8-0548]
MSADKQISSDDLLKLAASLTLVGDALALLAVEKAVEESAEGSGNKQSKDKKQTTAEITKKFRRFNGNIS